MNNRSGVSAQGGGRARLGLSKDSERQDGRRFLRDSTESGERGNPKKPGMYLLCPPARGLLARGVPSKLLCGGKRVLTLPCPYCVLGG